MRSGTGGNKPGEMPAVISIRIGLPWSAVLEPISRTSRAAEGLRKGREGGKLPLLATHAIAGPHPHLPEFLT